jgi:hypothetical protein
MRLLIRYMLSLFFLLWGTYAYIHHHRCYATNKVYQAATQTALAAHPNHRVCFSQAPPSNDTPIIYHRLKATIIEEEDEETESSRDHSASSNNAIPFFYVQLPGSVCHNGKNRLPFCEHFSWSSATKFIFHRVIRV